MMPTKTDIDVRLRTEIKIDFAAMFNNYMEPFGGQDVATVKRSRITSAHLHENGMGEWVCTVFLEAKP